MKALFENKGLTAVAILFLIILGGYIAAGGFGDRYTDATGQYSIKAVPIAEGLKTPWSLAFLPNGDMLVTEKFTGNLRIIRNGHLQAEPITGLPAIYASAQGGLLEVALHPKFKDNGEIYITYSKPGQRGATLALARVHFDGTRVSNIRDIFVADAWSRDNGQYGGKIAFDRDGILFLSAGDRRDRRERAQNTMDHAGKILRLRDDGTVPDDNPFVGKTGYRPEIYAYGIRNPYGLVIDPTGNIFEDEMGPQGGDELNLILPGRNYGWPTITYGREYSGGLINGGLRGKEGMEQPLAYWVPSISPGGIAYYTGDRFPKWKGNLFMGALSGHHLRRIVLSGTKVVEQESLLPRLGRIRDVRQGPDGYLYIVTDADPGAVLRIESAN